MAKPTFTWEQIRTHNTQKDAWTVIDGEVYDLTSFAKRHPGGDLIYYAAGQDGSTHFHCYHVGTNAHKVLSKLHIGTLATSEPRIKMGEFHNELERRVDALFKTPGFSKFPVSSQLDWGLSMLLNAMCWSLIVFGGSSLRLLGHTTESAPGWLTLACHALDALVACVHFTTNSRIIGYRHAAGHGSLFKNWRYNHLATLACFALGGHDNGYTYFYGADNKVASDSMMHTFQNSAEQHPASQHKFGHFFGQHVGVHHVQTNIVAVDFDSVPFSRAFVKDGNACLTKAHGPPCAVNTGLWLEWITASIFSGPVSCFALPIPMGLSVILEPFTYFTGGWGTSQGPLDRALLFAAGLCCAAQGFLYGTSMLYWGGPWRFVQAWVAIALYSHLMNHPMGLKVMHYIEEFQYENQADFHSDWGAIQVRRTINNEPVWWNMMDCPGTCCYHLEHHLFPGCNPHVLPVIQPVVRQCCKDFGLEYRQYTRKQVWDAYREFAKEPRSFPIKQESIKGGKAQ
mmetsp:Transcript_23009/g.78351  ORF Transcript_23009/g.78351 Transcript_23009/m.78351 type:complete len:511 (+) Transcript_23009:98-1630(+)